MAALSGSLSCNNLNVSNTAPINYNSNYASAHNSTSTLVSTSPSSDFILENSHYESAENSENNSFSFDNGGYYSPVGVRRTQIKPIITESETTEDEDKENNNSKIETSSGSIFSHSSVGGRNVKLFGNTPLLNISQMPRPQIHVKLMRAKSLSSELILGQNFKPNFAKTSFSQVDVDKVDIKNMYVSTLDVSTKRNGYFHKVSALFKKRSSKIINRASQSMEDVSQMNTSKIFVTNLNTSGSQLYITDIGLSGRSENLTKTYKKSTMKNLKDNVRERDVKFEDIDQNNIKVGISNADENLIVDSMEDLSHMSTPRKRHTPERSYSLLRHEIEQNDSSHVNFTRIPSLRRRKINVNLLHHFNTTLPPDENDDIHMIKEATHIQVLDNGEAVVTDILSNNMVLFDNEGHPKITFSFESGSEPWAVCLTPENCLAVTLKRQGCVSLWSTSGEPITEFGHNVLSGPTGIQCDRLGRFVVADEQANSVCVFGKQGELVTKLEASNKKRQTEVRVSPLQQKCLPSPPCPQQIFFNQPRYVCITTSGNYIIADSGNHCIKIFDQDFKFKSQFGCYGRADGCFKFPYGVASDDENNLYVADHFNNRVSLFSPEGDFVEHLITAQDDISRPKSIAIKHSRLYVTHGDIRSRKVSVFKLRKEF